MRVSKVENNNAMRKNILRSAKSGAIMAGGYLAMSHSYAWSTNRDTMLKTVEQLGGKLPYLKKEAIASTIIIATSAILSGFVSYLADKVSPVEPPRAVN